MFNLRWLNENVASKARGDVNALLSYSDEGYIKISHDSNSLAEPETIFWCAELLSVVWYNQSQD